MTTAGDRIVEAMNMIYDDMDAAMRGADAEGYSPEALAILMARIAAGVSGLAVAVKMLAQGQTE